MEATEGGQFYAILTLHWVSVLEVKQRHKGKRHNMKGGPSIGLM